MAPFCEEEVMRRIIPIRPVIVGTHGNIIAHEDLPGISAEYKNLMLLKCATVLMMGNREHLSISSAYVLTPKGPRIHGLKNARFDCENIIQMGPAFMSLESVKDFACVGPKNKDWTKESPRMTYAKLL